MTERDPVERDQDGWYLRCGDERRGPFKQRPQRTSSQQASATTRSGDGPAMQESHEVELWQVDGGHLRRERKLTTLPNGDVEVSERFLDAD